MQFQKTTLGFAEIQNRTLKLTAKQRRLLILIGSNTEDAMHQQLMQQLATPDLLEELMELALIEPTTYAVISSTDIETDTQETTASANSDSNTVQVTPRQERVFPIIPPTDISQPKNQPQTHNIESEIIYSPSLPQQQKQPITPRTTDHSDAFKLLQELMKNSLQQYCGLMAKQLVNKIERCETIQQLRHCQMQWLTSLQEARISPELLNATLNSVNEAFGQIE